MPLSTPLWLLGLAVAFGLPVAGFVRPTPAADELDWPAIRRGLALSWAALAVVVGIVALAGEPGDLGFRVPSVAALVDGVLYGFVAFAGTMLAVGLAIRCVDGLAADAASLAVFEQSLSRRLVAAVTAATVEVVLFYGFVVEALGALGGGQWLAGTVAAVGLLLVRARWGAEQAAQWIPGAGVLAAITVVTGNGDPGVRRPPRLRRARVCLGRRE